MTIRLLAVALLILLFASPAAEARSSGLSRGDTLVFQYVIRTSFSTPNGNTTNVSVNQFSVNVLSINLSAPLGEVGYSETVTEFNNTQVSTPSAVQNFTTIFDPYNNDTYIGNIGFYPFTYTDIRPGSTHGLNISLTITGSPAGNILGMQTVNASVTRSPSAIGINFTIQTSGAAPPSQNVMTFDATTGVLEHGVTYTHFFNVEKDFTYSLVSYAKGNPSSQDLIPYFLIGVAAVVVACAIIYVARRPSRRERRAQRLKDKMGR